MVDMVRPQPPARRIGQVELTFSCLNALRHLDDPAAKDRPAIARAGSRVFLACDEAAGIERPTRCLPAATAIISTSPSPTSSGRIR
jgi:hypothetical protein